MPKIRKPAPATVTKLKPAYDLVVKGGRLIDPANGIDAIRDIAIKKGRIAAVAPKLDEGKAKTIDAKGLIVTPGLIDTHAHVYQYVSGDFGLNPDLVGVRSGVTTVIDQGGPSALTFDGFRKFIVETAKTRVLAFISAYLAGGLLGHRYVDLYGAKEASRELKLPVYIHLGTLWPEAREAKVDAAKIIDEVVPLLDPGDILAHPFTKFPSGFVAPDGSIHPLVNEALARGVRIDVGRGAHFSFKNAERVIGAGILPFTIGADLHGYNVRLGDGGRAYRGMFTGEGVDSIVAEDRASPFARPYSLQHAMTELLALGVPLVEVVRMTTQNAAVMLGLEDEMGALSVGMPADLSAMRLVAGEFMLVDSERVTHPAKQLLHPEFAVRGGKLHRADSPLLPALGEMAA